MTFVTSAAGRAMIEKFEGKRNHAYPDPVSGGAPWTCGIGCTGPDVGPDTVWTDAEVDQKFSERLTRQYEPAVNHLVEGSPTTQGQFDALVSLAFNVGPASEGHSSVIALHRAGKYDDAADAFMLYDHARGREIEALAERREAEGQMYLDASPGQTMAQPAPAPAVVVPVDAHPSVLSTIARLL
jgi:lysozyme